MSIEIETNPLEQFQWQRQPQAEAWLRHTVQGFLSGMPRAKAFADRLLREAGVRFTDLVGEITIDREVASPDDLREAGWRQAAATDHYVHSGGIFPPIRVSSPGSGVRVGMKVDSVADFLATNQLERNILGEPGAARRSATIEEQPSEAEWYIVERHGGRPFDGAAERVDLGHAARVLERFRMRRRDFPTDAEGIQHAGRLIEDAVAQVGHDRACDLFFQAEREFWMRRNRAGQVQYARQQKLGIGWANHDHHTYRCSRGNFTKLVALWEKLGLVCRERFYAGREAGWGAQVMEQPAVGIVTFNDVDLSPEELMNDFAHEPLEERDQLGTVGLWCGLHGDSILQAGMHHLECQFDFDSLKRQLEQEHGVSVMKPFTDFPYLRQAFTEGERWPVDPQRIDRLLRRGLITPQQAAQFREQGAIGSHLENLERNEGFKGFNQTGVSEIISATDPRKHLAGA